MATVVNDRDIQLEAISPRVAGVTLSANITVTQDQVDGLGLVLNGTKSATLAITSQVIQVQTDGTTLPASVVLTANIQNLTETPTLTIVPGSGTMSVTPALTAGSFSFTPAQLTSDTITFQLQVVDAGVTYTDQMTVLKVYQGSDGLAALLTNESCTLPADYLGNVPSYTGAGGAFKVYHGTTDVTSVCTFSIPTGGNPDSLTTSINASGGSAGVYSVTAGFPSAHDFTSVTFRATFGTTTIDKVFTIAKAKAGTNGGGGSNTATVYLFQRTATSTPPLVPDATVTYTFSTGAATGVDQGWTQSMPTTGGGYRWITQATALSTGATDTIATTEWATPAILAQDGSSGLNNALVFLYQRAASTPAVPTATVTYTFASGVATGVSAPWTQTIPAGSNPLYVTVATAVGSGATDTIATGEWATPVILAQNGVDGGAGTAGHRGSVTLYVALTGSTNTWSDSTAASAITTYTSTAPMILDVVTEYNNSQSFSITKFFDGTNWQTVNAVINGNLLVTGTVGGTALVGNSVTADKIDSRNLTIKDSAGNIVFSSGTIIGSGNLYKNGDFSKFSAGIGSPPDNFSLYNNSGVSVAQGGATTTGFISATTGYWSLTPSTTPTSNFGFALAGSGWGGWSQSVDYVWSFYARAPLGGASIGTTFYDAWNNAPASVTWLLNPPLTGNFQRYALRVNFGTNTVDPNGFIGITVPPHAGERLDFSCIQIETGSTPSGFAPAPTLGGLGFTGDTNATYGATFGSNISGQINSGNVSTYIASAAIGQTQIGSAAIGTLQVQDAAITSTKIVDLRTSNYSEDGSGNPTAGAKLSSTGTALKVANSGLQVGTAIFTDYWTRLVQGIDGASGTAILWRGNNDATTRGGAPNINCLSITALYDQMLNSNFQQTYFNCTITPTSYTSYTDNLDAMTQIHLQFFEASTSNSPFTECYLPCPSRTYDGASGIVQSSLHWGWRYGGTGSSGTSSLHETNNSYDAYLRVRMANTYGWSATKDLYAGGSSASVGRVMTATTITGSSGSSGGGGGGTGGACPAPWVKVALFGGRLIDASDLFDGSVIEAVNDSSMLPMPKGAIVRRPQVIWKPRLQVTLTGGRKTEWSYGHRFCLVGGEWVAIQDLRPGDHIMGPVENIVESIVPTGEGPVVSFQVEGAGTYFAGDMLSHNSKVIP